LYGIAFVAGVWLMPVTQYTLNHPQQERLLAQVLSYRQQPLEILFEEIGPPHRIQNGVMSYDPSPWYAPLGIERVRLVSLEEGVLSTAYIDD